MSTTEEKVQSTVSIDIQQISGGNIMFLRKLTCCPESMNHCRCCNKIVEKGFCKGCRVIKYCSKQCQLQDWPFHKEECKDVHGVNWILPGFSYIEKDYFRMGAENKIFVNPADVQNATEGRDMRGCAPTAQILTHLLCDPANDYFRVYEEVMLAPNPIKNNRIQIFVNTITYLPTTQRNLDVPTALIYSCAVTAANGRTPYSHWFTITQYGRCGDKPTYRLWQAYAENIDNVVYTLSDWFDPSFKLEGVHSQLRQVMTSEQFQELFLLPLMTMMTDITQRSTIWKQLFGYSKLPECELIGLQFIAGHAYQYAPYMKAITK